MGVVVSTRKDVLGGRASDAGVHPGRQGAGQPGPGQRGWNPGSAVHADPQGRGRELSR